MPWPEYFNQVPLLYLRNLLRLITHAAFIPASGTEGGKRELDQSVTVVQITLRSQAA